MGIIEFVAMFWAGILSGVKMAGDGISVIAILAESWVNTMRLTVIGK